jgi:hypothetical protein
MHAASFFTDLLLRFVFRNGYAEIYCSYAEIHIDVAPDSCSCMCMKEETSSKINKQSS